MFHGEQSLNKLDESEFCILYYDTGSTPIGLFCQNDASRRLDGRCVFAEADIGDARVIEGRHTIPVLFEAYVFAIEPPCKVEGTVGPHGRNRSIILGNGTVSRI